MAVVLDTVGTELTVSGLTSFSAGNENTVGSGIRRALVVFLGFSNQSVSGVSLTWDNGGTNQAMSLIKTVNTTGTIGRVEIWGLVNPASGTLALAGSWTGASDAFVIGVSYTGVDQTGGATSFPHSTSATGTASTAALTITSVTGNATVAVACSDADNFSSTSQTQVLIDNTNSPVVNFCASRSAGAATVTHTMNTSTTTGHWAEVGTDILAFGDTQEWFPRSSDARSSRVDGPHVTY